MPSRRGVKRSKDLYYIHEIAVLFRNVLPEIAETRRSVDKEFPKPWSTRFRKNLSSLFFDPSSEGPQAAAKIGNLDPTAVFQATSKLVEAILK